jgi:hypothetical protein
VEHKFALHASLEAGMSAADQIVYGAKECIELEPQEDLPEDLIDMAPHLRGCTCLRVPFLPKDELANLMKGQIIVSCHTVEDEAVEATGVQIPGLLDELFYYDDPLGPRVGRDGVDITLWAPTAQNVEVLLYEKAKGGEPEVLAMQPEKLKGVWQLSGPTSWEWKYYTFRSV